MLDRSLREPLSVLNANYILLDSDKNNTDTFGRSYFKSLPDGMMYKITNEINKTTN